MRSLTPSTWAVAAFLTLLCGPVIADTVAPRVQAQVFVPPPDYSTASASDRAYTDASINSLNATLNSTPSVNAFGTTMVANGVVASPPQVSSAVSGLVSLAALPSVAVTALNGQKGPVTLVGYYPLRSGDQPVSATTGQVSFGFSLTSTPVCSAAVKSSNAGYVFSAPRIVSEGPTGVTFEVLAMPKVVTVASLTVGTTFWTAPPSGTTLNITCVPTS